MFTELEDLVTRLGLSQGELLQIAREISANDNLRTIDRLTALERVELVSVLESWYCALDREFSMIGACK